VERTKPKVIALKSWAIVKRAATDFISDNALTYAAAVAFYTALSFAPMLLITLMIVGFLGESAQMQVVDEVRSVIGPAAAGAVDVVIQNARDEPSTGSIAGILGIAMLLVSATGVLAQLQAALNAIWHVEAKPGSGIWDWLRKRVLTLGLLLVVLSILLVSLGINAALSLLIQNNGWIWQLVNASASLIVFTLLFAAIFKVLPDVDVAWKDVWMGAAATAVLFAFGKALIGMYLVNSGLSSTYGAAGSVIIFLVWVFYSTTILLFGAELTQACAQETGSRFEPEKNAQWTDESKAKANEA